MANKICPVCGKEIINPSNSQKYCSENCRRKANRNDERVQWHVDGVAPIKYSLIAAYHGECAICGWKISSSLMANSHGLIEQAYGNELHHIVPVRDGGQNVPENLILLCPNHHKQANAGLISADELRKHQKSVPLPPDEVEKDIKAIQKAAAEYQDFLDTHGYDHGASPECTKFCMAVDLAIMLGDAKLIKSYQHKNYLGEGLDKCILVSDVKRIWTDSLRKIAKNDRGSNEYPVREKTFYDICLDIK